MHRQVINTVYLTFVILLCIVCWTVQRAEAQYIVTSNSHTIHPARITAAGDEKWDDRFGDIGASFSVWKVFAVGTDLYVGGEFTTLGGATINHIAKWNGRSYSSLGSGLTGSYPATTIEVTPLDMLMHGSDLYVCGNFNLADGDSVKGIAKWSGGHWYPLGTGADNIVHSIAIDGNYLYAGGNFRTIGGISANRIARYNLVTETWEPLGPGVGDDIQGGIQKIVIHNGYVYAGGNFTNAGSQEVNHIAVWDGTQWSSLLQGIHGNQASVEAMVFVGSTLYVGGNFYQAGTIYTSNLARWDGYDWSAVGTGADWGINDLMYDGTDLYIAGGFNTVNGTSVSHIARMNPLNNSVTPVGAGLYNVYPTNGSVISLTKTGTDIYAGGMFSGSDSANAYYIARWNTETNKYYALGKGTNSTVFSISVHPDHPADVYVGGQFSRPSGKYIDIIAQFNGDTWEPVGSGVWHYCYANVATSNDLYIAGQLNTAGGVSIANIAKWNFSSHTWSALGSGLTGGYYVYALGARGNDIFAGGDFTTAGGSPASRIAKWDGTSWTPLGSGLNGIVRAIAVTDSFVYAGGEFTSAGGNPANYIARWDGTNWTTLGSGSSNGTDYHVYAIAVSGNDVYVGGIFASAGGVSTEKIAKWNSATHAWSALGSGVDWYGGGAVNAIATNNKNVYVGGMFVTAGGTEVSNIAVWNDSTATWSTMGSGVDNEVKALALSSTGKLYVGGLFLNAGGKPSYRFAIWDASSATIPLPPVPVSPAIDSSCVALNPTLQWSASEGAASYRVQLSTDSLFATSFLDSGTITLTSITVSGLTPTTTYYWRVNATNSAGTSLWSTVLHFTTGTATMLPPSQVSPVNGATGIPASTTLYWQQPCGAQSYILQIAYDSNYTSLFFTGGGITRTWYDLFELPASTWHYWRLRSVNGTDTSAWSATWKFRTWGGEPYSPTLAGPANDTSCISLNPVLSWNAVSGATSYRIQLSTDSLFGATNFDSSNHTTTSITVRGLLPLTKYYWRVNASNGYGASGWSGVRCFTTRTGVFPAPTMTSPADGTMNIPTVTTLTWERPCGAQSFYLQIAYDSAFTSLIFNSGGITATQYPLTELPTATWHYWRLRSVSGPDTSVWSSTWKFMTVGGSVTVYLQYSMRWNLLSIPLTVSDNRTGTIFPSATSSAFRYSGSGYVTAESLHNGVGYWLKFSKMGIEPLTGVTRLSDTIAVQRGWNLIGSVSSTIPVSRITSIPPGLVTSNFFGYNSGYFITDSIKTGVGYWVHVSGSGSLILSSASFTSSQSIRITSFSGIPPPAPGEDISNTELSIPNRFALEQNYPNPFNPSTVISYSLSENCYVTLTVYNTLGEKIATLIDGMQDAGYKSISFDASALPSGIYTYRLTAGTSCSWKKMMLIR